jgi:hypothetical protein
MEGMLMATPQYYQETRRDPADGKLKRYTYNCGPIFEVDEGTGRARLAKMLDGKKSPLYPSRSYVALGYDDARAPQTIAAGASTALQNFDIQEIGWLGRLFLTGMPAAPTVYVTACQIRGDALFSGNVNADQFRTDAVHSPVFGHCIDRNTQLGLNIRNAGLGPITIGASWSLI